MKFNEDDLEQMILDGIVEFAGLDSNGEMLYSFAKDIETRSPEVYKIVQQMHMQDIYTLWEMGFLSMDVTEANPLARVTERAFDEEALSALPTHMRIMLEQIKDAMRIEGGE
jgi:hypothetical protein